MGIVREQLSWTDQFIYFGNPLAGRYLRIEQLAVALGQIHQVLVSRMSNDWLRDQHHLLKAQG